MALLTALDRSVLKTLVYFDLLDFPVTPLELLNDLYGMPSTLSAVTNSLHQLQKANRVSSAEGFYFLPKREALVRQRKDRYLIADEKFKIAIRNANLLKRLPFVRAIFVANSLAYSNASPDSDIDFVIITEPGRIWTARFFCAGLMKLLKRRPTADIKKDRICLSFYATSDVWSFEPLTYDKDISFAFWLNHWWPIFDPQNLTLMLRNNNPWLKHMLPNCELVISNERRSIAKKSFVQKMFEFFLPKRFEAWTKKYQLKIMPEALTSAAKLQPKNVALSDSILKLHDKDSRERMNEAWVEKCKTLVPGFEIKEILKIISGTAK